MFELKRLVMTGAAGYLARTLRPQLGKLAENRRLSDIAEMDSANAGEEIVQCDLADFGAVLALVKGCDGIIHLGGIPVEDRFANILDSNIIGCYNLYEAARKTGVKRIVFASSNHAIGFHERTTRLDADAVTRPDSLYGVSKVYGEALARLYHDKFGIETAIVRIGSCLPKPLDRRMLSTWLSPDDFFRLIERAFTVPHLGCPIIYGVSDNRDSWWDNGKTACLGWKPQDSADVFRVGFGEPSNGSDTAEKYQGGRFAAAGHFEDPDN
jgi:uronate dehydrogenase